MKARNVDKSLKSFYWIITLIVLAIIVLIVNLTFSFITLGPLNDFFKYMLYLIIICPTIVSSSLVYVFQYAITSNIVNYFNVVFRTTWIVFIILIYISFMIYKFIENKQCTKCYTLTIVFSFLSIVFNFFVIGLLVVAIIGYRKQKQYQPSIDNNQHNSQNIDYYNSYNQTNNM